jgi:hypothetical protein
LFLYSRLIVFVSISYSHYLLYSSRCLQICP